MTHYIKGSAIHLKRLTTEDVSAEYVSWLNDQAVNKYLECRFIEHTVQSVKKYINSLNREDSDELIFGIYRNLDSKHIGNIKIGPINRHHQHAAIGLVIGDKSSWGNGYGSKAIRLISDYAFKELELESLYAGCYEQNIGSYKAFLKAGWEVTGKIKAHWKDSHGERLDEILMSKIKNNKISFPKKNGVTLIGSGELLLKTAEILQQTGISTCVILAPRHQDHILENRLTTHGTLIIKTNNINCDKEVHNTLHKFNRLCLCFGPAWIFEDKILQIYSGRIFNFNGIPLPNYLGGAHFTWQIINNSTQGGAFIQQITSDVDRGPIAMEKSYALPADTRLPIQYETYNNIKGEELINKFLDQCLNDDCCCELDNTKLDWGKSTYYPRLLTKTNAWINWSWLGDDIFKFCNAFDAPYPGARTLINRREVTLTNVEIEDQEIKHHPYCYGLIIRVSTKGNICWIAISNGSLKATVNTVEGDRQLFKLNVGDRFYTPNKNLVGSLSRIKYSESGVIINAIEGEI